MKKRKCILLLLALTLFTSGTISAQNNSTDIPLDALLIQGEYNEAVVKCSELIQSDSLNPEIYYKLGLAYQNLMQTEKSIDAFSKAIKLSPDIKKYSFSLASYYYNLGKIRFAQPIFINLCNQDSTNWIYSYFLTDIYMQKGLYNNALPIYKRFFDKDTTNTTYIDKYAFCNLRMGYLDTAIILYEKSLLQNSQNISALKNLSYLYLKKGLVDTAIYQLTRGIEIDSSDIDLYNRRADIYYSQNWHFRARPDFFRILASGDSSKLVLKKLGIGLAYNNQPLDALNYLLASYQMDSSDFETTSYIGQVFYKLKQYKKSIKYYNRVLKLLNPIYKQIDITNVLLADSYKDSSQYNEAIKYYSKSLDFKYSARMCLTIANIYDDKLKSYDKAISYYQLFFNNLDQNEFALGDEYIMNVRKRLDWLVENKNKKKVKSNKKQE